MNVYHKMTHFRAEFDASLAQYYVAMQYGLFSVSRCKLRRQKKISGESGSECHLIYTKRRHQR